MATVKFFEGKKEETSFNVPDDEGIIYVSTDKNVMMRFIPQGCFKGNKTYRMGFIITSKRIITVPLAPNKKNYPADSFYWKDISGAKMVQSPAEANSAAFTLNMKSAWEGGQFWVCMEVTAKNLFTAFKAQATEDAARNAAYNSIVGKSFDDGVYTQKSIDKYYAAMEKRAKERAANLDFSSAGHAQIRDFIVDMINDCAAEAAKG